MLNNFLEIKALLFSLTYWARYIQGQEKKKKADQFQILNPPPKKKKKKKTILKICCVTFLFVNARAMWRPWMFLQKQQERSRVLISLNKYS